MAVSINAYKGAWSNEQIVHLLKRMTFGAKPEDLAYFAKRTHLQTVDELLNTLAPANHPLNNYEANYADPTGVKAGQTWVKAAYGDGTVNGQRRNSMKAWWIGQMLNQPRSIEEKLILFWHNHFATEMDTIGDARLCYTYHEVLRKYATGNFKAFVKAITLNVGMLVYLNGRLNVKTAPDENYARELQELFTVGKGPNSKYTEDDVKAAARVLTGYRINADTLTYVFSAANHDTTDKVFSAFYGSKTIKGQTGAAGETELDDLLTMLFANNELAMHICRKLYRFFFYYEITAEIEANFITPLAKVFRDNNYEIKPLLRTMFLSEHFFDATIAGAAIKNPIEHVVGYCREMGVVFPDATDYVSQYATWNVTRSQASNMQLDIGDPPNVSGWVAYYQEPQFYELWINSDTYPKRNLFTDTMLGNGYTGNGKRIQVDVLAFAKKLANPEDPNKLIDQALQLLYRIGVTQENKTAWKTQSLLSGQTSDYYWTDAWNAYIAKPTDTMAMNTVKTRLTALLKTIVALPEYQLA